jgi:F0F1-type ATP synthase membrane subunit c/vacuolar-type H+-ATPase subunit K
VAVAVGVVVGVCVIVGARIGVGIIFSHATSGVTKI